MTSYGGQGTAGAGHRHAPGIPALQGQNEQRLLSRMIWKLMNQLSWSNRDNQTDCHARVEARLTDALTKNSD